MQKIFSQRQISAVERLVYWQGKRMRTVNCLTEDYHDDKYKMLPLSLSVDLICCIETFFAMVLLIQSPDLLTMNGLATEDSDHCKTVVVDSSMIDESPHTSTRKSSASNQA
ncbi:hypothetical protein DICVIV_12794 [Dictyocaulus viviparus]|uniref:Uncharacterized protein n=1 Tax=Dictyocaulus viviparus TaxID=29172 RepID=A0A0D8X9H3_DICVI|nr:hypothetical protein DICVIV_12794 [Dictyocaulus viviparus]